MSIFFQAYHQKRRLLQHQGKRLLVDDGGVHWKGSKTEEEGHP